MSIPANPHCAISEKMMAAADEFPMPENEAEVATLAAVQQATLALAYEQRTANLIALYSNGIPEYLLTNESWAAVRAQIAERLGLEGTE